MLRGWLARLPNVVPTAIRDILNSRTGVSRRSTNESDVARTLIRKTVNMSLLSHEPITCQAALPLGAPVGVAKGDDIHSRCPEAV